MNRQKQDLIEQLTGTVEHRDAILEDLRAILVQQGDDVETLRQARIALSGWFIATYPHLYPDQGRPQLRLIEGGGEGTGRLF
jgi:hypothetical protein